MAPQAVIETRFGNITLELLEDKAPKHVQNFVDLARKSFYDGTTFHRVIPGFMIQGGCPNTKEHPDRRAMHGTGNPGYRIDAEFNDTKHVRGVVSAARSSDPNSAGCQFFIVVNDAVHLDGSYTAFGKVTDGLEVVDQIVSQPRDGRDNPDERTEMKVRVLE